MTLTSVFKSDIETLDELFYHQIADLYDAENEILEALPEMIEKASSQELKAAFKHHKEETQRQKERLEDIFRRLDKSPERSKCAGIRGIISEGEELIDRMKPEAVRDAGIIASAQRVEHYEMAAYGAARNYARLLGDETSAQLLQQSLNEEAEADKKLTQIAEQSRNLAAKQVTD